MCDLVYLRRNPNEVRRCCSLFACATLGLADELGEASLCEGLEGLEGGGGFDGVVPLMVGASGAQVCLARVILADEAGSAVLDAVLLA